MNLLRIIQRPEYFWRPRQIWRRLRKEAILARHQVRLAWELPVELDPYTPPGIDMWNLGVDDRIVPEAICRLLDPGERAIDVGANVGQSASLMALTVGPRGQTVAFEPGPRAARLLATNAGVWAAYDMSAITVVRQALSDRIGTALLHESINLGGCTLEERPVGLRLVKPPGSQGIDVEVTTLDAFVPQDTDVGLLKIDVEGHELQVLKGSRRLLEQRRIRDVVFEDFHPHPSPVAALLQAADYTVFLLLMAWRKPLTARVAEFPGDPRTRPRHRAVPSSWLEVPRSPRPLEAGAGVSLRRDRLGARRRGERGTLYAFSCARLSSPCCCCAACSAVPPPRPRWSWWVPARPCPSVPASSTMAAAT